MRDTNHTADTPRIDTPRQRTLTPLLAALLALALIAACAQAPTPEPEPEPEPATLSGTAVASAPDDEDPVPLLGGTLLLFDPDVAFAAASTRGGADGATVQALQAKIAGLDVDASTVAPSNVVEVEDGVYLAGIALVESDGSYELVLPDGDAIPAALMRPAEDAIPLELYLGDDDCSLVASDPSVLVTLTFWIELSSPAPIFFTPFGPGFTFTATEAFDLAGDVEGITFVTATYATGATTLSTTGTECASVDGELSADASLVEGWNQVTWTLTEDTITIGARPIDQSVFSLVVNGGF